MYLGLKKQEKSGIMKEPNKITYFYIGRIKRILFCKGRIILFWCSHFLPMNLIKMQIPRVKHEFAMNSYIFDPDVILFGDKSEFAFLGADFGWRLFVF